MKWSFENTFQRQGIAQGQLTIGITHCDDTGVMIVSELCHSIVMGSLHWRDQCFRLIIPELQSTFSIGKAEFVFEGVRVQGVDSRRRVSLDDGDLLTWMRDMSDGRVRRGNGEIQREERRLN